MAVCPRRSGASGWPSAPPIGSPPDGRLPSDQTASTPTPCLCKYKKGDPVGSPFDSGTDQKNQLKVIVDDPYLYRSSFSFAAS